MTENTSASSRTGELHLGEKTLTIVQQGKNCDFTVSPTSLDFPAEGGSATLTVTADPTSCTWECVNSLSWLDLSPATGVGNLSITATATANTATEARQGTITVAGQNVTVTQAAAEPENEAPVAEAGADQSVIEGAAVSLDGSASSDADGQITAYLWQQQDADASRVTLDGANAALATFIAPTPGGTSETLHFTLTVTDDGGATASDTTSVTVTALNPTPPAPDAGDDQNVVEGQTVTLLAALGLRNADGFAWTQTEGAAVALSHPDQAETTFVTPPVPQGETLTLRFQVTATDDLGQQGSDETNVTVTDNGLTGFAESALPLQAKNNATLAFETSGGGLSRLERVETSTRETKFEDTDWGRWSMELIPEAVGGQVQLTVSLDQPADANLDWYLHDERTGWQAMQATFDDTRTSLVLTLTDGGEGDLDGSADGRVEHEGALGRMVTTEDPEPEPEPEPDGGSSGGGGCQLRPGASTPLPWLLALAALAFVLLRRRS